MGLNNRHVFGLAMGLSLAIVALAGVLIAIRANFDPATGPTRLIFGFEAVIIGGLSSFWGTLAGGIILGVVQSVAAAMIPAIKSSPAMSRFWRCWRFGRQVCSGAGCGLDALSVRPSRSTRLASGFIAALVLGLASAPFLASNDMLRLLIDFFLYVALACLWNFLAGYAGLVSVGQQAFVGLGGYGLFALATKAGVPPLLSVPIVGLVAAAVSIPMAALLFRLRGAYFAISSWVAAEVFRLSAKLITPLGGGSGMSLPARIAQSVGRTPHDRFVAVYVMTLLLLVAILGIILLVLRSRTGMALTAIRDNEIAARSSGVNVDRTKLIVYVVTACGTAMVGALIFLQRLRISPDAAFSVNDWTALIIFIVVIGGIGSFEGPILGAIVYFFLRETLAELGPLYLIILAPSPSRSCCSSRAGYGGSFARAGACNCCRSIFAWCFPKRHDGARPRQEDFMLVKRFADSKPYEAPNHRGVLGLRLQASSPAGPSISGSAFPRFCPAAARGRI